MVERAIGPVFESIGILAPRIQTIDIESRKSTFGNMFLDELVPDVIHDLQESVDSKRSLLDCHSIQIFSQLVAATAKPRL